RTRELAHHRRNLPNPRHLRRPPPPLTRDEFVHDSRATGLTALRHASAPAHNHRLHKPRPPDRLRQGLQRPGLKLLPRLKRTRNHVLNRNLNQPPPPHHRSRLRRRRGHRSRRNNVPLLTCSFYYIKCSRSYNIHLNRRVDQRTQPPPQLPRSRHVELSLPIQWVNAPPQP